MPLVELVAALVEPAMVVQVLAVAALVGPAVVVLVVLAAAALVIIAVAALLELEVAALVLLELALEAALAVPLLAIAAPGPYLHTYSALFAASSLHLEPDIANRHSPSLRLDPSPSPLAPLPHPSFDCR